MEAIAKKINQPAENNSGNFRVDCYVILAALLRQPPSADLVNLLLEIECAENVPEKINYALAELRRAVQSYPLSIMETEFNKLFVGLGCGEMVPYASWYKEKKIQSLTLALLRRDLSHFAIIRQTDNAEPEDHAGALCESMALIAAEAGNIPPAAQADFFHQYIASWMINFFQDFQTAKNARFYRSVGLFGSCFLQAEQEYFQYVMNVSMINRKRRNKK
jgi:TorA maturation chaperone TorD